MILYDWLTDWLTSRVTVQVHEVENARALKKKPNYIFDPKNTWDARKETRKKLKKYGVQQLSAPHKERRNGQQSAQK